jgi:hypothetical protein
MKTYKIKKQQFIETKQVLTNWEMQVVKGGDNNGNSDEPLEPTEKNILNIVKL